MYLVFVKRAPGVCQRSYQTALSGTIQPQKYILCFYATMHSSTRTTTHIPKRTCVSYCICIHQTKHFTITHIHACIATYLTHATSRTSRTALLVTTPRKSHKASHKAANNTFFLCIHTFAAGHAWSRGSHVDSNPQQLNHASFPPLVVKHCKGKDTAQLSDSNQPQVTLQPSYLRLATMVYRFLFLHLLYNAVMTAMSSNMMLAMAARAVHPCSCHPSSPVGIIFYMNPKPCKDTTSSTVGCGIASVNICWHCCVNSWAGS